MNWYCHHKSALYRNKLKSELEFTKQEENKQKAIVLYLIEEKNIAKSCTLEIQVLLKRSRVARRLKNLVVRRRMTKKSLKSEEREEEVMWLNEGSQVCHP